MRITKSPNNNSIMYQIGSILGKTEVKTSWGTINSYEQNLTESEICETIKLKYRRIFKDLNVSEIQVSKNPNTIHFQDDETGETFYISESARTVRVFGTNYNPNIYKFPIDLNYMSRPERLQQYYIQLLAGILRKRVRYSFTKDQVMTLPFIQKRLEEKKKTESEKVQAEKDRVERERAEQIRIQNEVQKAEKISGLILASGYTLEDFKKVVSICDNCELNK